MSHAALHFFYMLCGPYLSAGGIAQEREVCRKLLKFANVSTTPMGVVAASNKESEEKGEGSA